MRLIIHHDDKQITFENVDIGKNPRHGDIYIKGFNTLAPIDEEKYNNIKEFAENYTSEVRLEQGITFLRDELQLEISPKNTGAFIKWVVQDVIKEEKDNIIENGFDFKKVAQAISKIASKWYLKHI